MKRKTKKPVSVLLCIVLLLSLIPLTAFADDSKAVKITDEAKVENFLLIFPHLRKTKKFTNIFIVQNVEIAEIT